MQHCVHKIYTHFHGHFSIVCVRWQRLHNQCMGVADPGSHSPCHYKQTILSHHLVAKITHILLKTPYQPGLQILPKRGSKMTSRGSMNQVRLCHYKYLPAPLQAREADYQAPPRKSTGAMGGMERKKQYISHVISHHIVDNMRRNVLLHHRMTWWLLFRHISVSLGPCSSTVKLIMEVATGKGRWSGYEGDWEYRRGVEI